MPMARLITPIWRHCWPIVAQERPLSVSCMPTTRSAFCWTLNGWVNYAGNTMHSFHCDTVQTIAHYPINLSKINVHFITAAAHKFHGPKGGHAVHQRRCVHQTAYSWWCPGTQYAGRYREPVRYHRLAKAMEMAYDELDTTATYIKGLRKMMADALLEHFPVCASTILKMVYTPY